MSLEQLRENNIRLATEKALECFIERGIEKTKVSDIATRADLTERSMFRYFPTKMDIVVAASFLYWERAKSRTAAFVQPEMSGIEAIAAILRGYSGMVLVDPDGIRFSLDAEMALNTAGKNHKVVNRPPERFESTDAPMATAIRKGLADGTVDATADIKTLYYNSYDAILGLMQRMTVGVPSVNEIDGAARLSAICDMFVEAFRNKNK